MDATKKPNKRVTPGRTAKGSNKRKQSVESPEKTRAVRARLSEEAAATMATPITLEMLRGELAANSKEMMDKLDKSLLDLTGKVCANTQMIYDERRERKEELRMLNEKIESLMKGNKNDMAIPSYARPASSRPQCSARENDEYNKYERARRTLIFYPIDGEDTNSMFPSLQQFLSKKMMIPTQ